MKALVACAGRGTRLRPLTFTRTKQLLPVANRPVLSYVVGGLVQAGFRDIGIVVSPDNQAAIRAALDDGRVPGARFTLITQEVPLGLAHAVSAARSFLGKRWFVLHLGDCLIDGGVTDLIAGWDGPEAEHPVSRVLLAPVANPGRFGVAVLKESGEVVRLVEKPKSPPSDLALVGAYLFHPAIFEAIDTLRPGSRGEYEITDAIQGLVDRGFTVAGARAQGWWQDAGSPEGLLEANRLALSGLTGNVAGEVTDSFVAGQVVVEDGARVRHSILESPVHIATGAVVDGSRIGPYASVGRKATVVRSEVGNSIIMEEAEVLDLPYRLDATILGQGAAVRGGGKSRRSLRLVVGDLCQLDL